MGNGNESGGGGGSPKKDPTREKIRKRQGKLNETQKDGLSLQDQVNKSIKEHETYLTGQYNALKKTIKATGEAIRQQVEYQAMIAAASLAVASFTGILKGANYVLNKFINISKTTIKTLTMMPILIGNFAASMGNQVRSELVETIGNATEGLKEFFDTASNGGGAVSNLGRIASGSLGAFQSVNSELTRLFGFGATGAAQMIQQLGQAINGMGVFAELFADSPTQRTKSIIYFQKMTKGLGMSAEDTKYITLEAAKNGEHYFDTMLRVKDASDSASKQFGINRKRLSIGFFDLRKDIVNFGHLSEPALMAVVGRATQLGVSMESLKGVFSKFDTFESAATSAAQLQQAFGMNIDALQLIRAEDPMQIVEMFRQSMLMTGRSFDDLNRHEKSLMASHTGMSAETLKSIMNYRTLGKSFEEIKKIMNDQKPEERHIRAMKDMNSSVTQVKKAIEGKGFFQNFADGVVASIKYNSDLGKSFVKVSARMERFYEHGLSLSRGQKKMLNDALRPLTKIVDSIIGPNGPFSKNVFKKFKTKVLSNLSEFVRDVFGDKSGKSKLAVRDAQKKWTNKLKNIFDFNNLMSDQSFIGKIFQSSGRIIGVVVRGLVVAIPALTQSIGEMFNQGLVEIDNVFNSQTDMGQKVKEWLGFSESEGDEIFAGITSGLADMRKTFMGEKGQKGLFERAFDNAKSIFRNAGKLILEGLMDNREVLQKFMEMMIFSVYQGVLELLMKLDAFSALFSDKAGANLGATQASQRAGSIGAEKAVQQAQEYTESRDFLTDLQDANDVEQNRMVAEAYQAARLAHNEGMAKVMALHREAMEAGDKDMARRHLREMERLKERSYIFYQGTEFHDTIEGMFDDESIFSEGHEGFLEANFGERMRKAFGNEMMERLGAQSEVFGKILRNERGVTGQDRYKFLQAALVEMQEAGQLSFKVAREIKRTEALRKRSELTKQQLLKKQEEERKRKLKKSLELMAAESEKGRKSKLYGDASKYGMGQLDVGGGMTLGMLGARSAEGKAAIKNTKYRVDAHKGLDEHPALRAIANLVGEKGKDAKLTKEDFIMLSQMKGEEAEKLRQDLKTYFAERPGQNVVVTIDGHAVTAHITKTMAEQQKLKPLGKGGPTIATPADPSRLKPAAGSPAPASGT